MQSKDVLQAIKEEIDRKVNRLKELKQISLEIPQVEKEIQSLKHTYEIMGGKDLISTPSHIPPPNLAANSSDHISISDATERVFRTVGKPLSLNDILKHIASNYDLHPKKSTLYTSIARHLGKGKKFRKVRPGIYALNMDFKAHNIDREKENSKNEKGDSVEGENTME